MADPPPYPDSNNDADDDTGVEPDHGLTSGAPCWVKVFGIIAVTLILLFVVIQFTGIGGGHGPGRHTPSGDVGGQVSSSSITLFSLAEAHTSSEGGHG